MLAPKRNETPMEYWISLWPAAPLFGVPWRFEGMMPAASFFRPSDVAAKMTRAGAREAAATAADQKKAAEAAAHRAAEAVSAMAATIDAKAVEIVEAVAPVETQAAAPEVAEAATPAAETSAAEALAPEAPAASAFAPEPEGAAAVAPATLYATAPDATDDLKQIKGVGPKLETMLNEMGIYRLDQIAAMSPENLAWVSENLTAFKTRPMNDDWVAQAKALI